MNREGKTYKHKRMGAVVVVVKTRRMSSGTARHTVLVLDVPDGAPGGRKVGDQVEIDEVPVEPFERYWEEI